MKWPRLIGALQNIPGILSDIHYIQAPFHRKWYPLDCIWIRASHFNLGLEVREKTYMMINQTHHLKLPAFCARASIKYGPVEWLLKWGRPGGGRPGAKPVKKCWSIGICVGSLDPALRPRRGPCKGQRPRSSETW